MCATGLVAGPAYLAGVVGGEERTDHELTGLDGRDLVAGLLDDTHVLVPHGRRARHLVGAAPAPQVRTADAGGGQANDGVRRGDDLRVWSVDDLQVAGGVQNGTTHHSPPQGRFAFWPAAHGGGQVMYSGNQDLGHRGSPC